MGSGYQRAGEAMQWKHGLKSEYMIARGIGQQACGLLVEVPVGKQKYYCSNLACTRVVERLWRHKTAASSIKSGTNWS